MSQGIIKNPRRVFSPNNIGFINSIEDRVTILEDNEYKITYFTEISNSTGTITIPTGATILLDQLQGGIDAYVSQIENGQPNGEFPRTSNEVIVDVSSFDTLGNYTLDGTPSSYPVALIYILKIKAKDYSNLDIEHILDIEDNPTIENRVDRLQSTELFSGGNLSGTGTSTFSYTSGEGQIIDHSQVEPEVLFYGAFSGGSGITPLYTRTFIAIDNTGSLQQIDGSSDLTAEQRRDYIILGSLAFLGGIILAIQEIPATSQQTGPRLDDLALAIGVINVDGNLIGPNGANLLINKSSGHTYRSFSNTPISKKVRDITADPVQIPVPNANVLIGYRSGVGDVFSYTSYTGITPDDWDNGSGTIATVSNNKWTIQRIYFFNQTNTYVVYLGQTEYFSKDAAIAAIDNETRIIDVNTSLSSLRSNLIIEKGATVLNDDSVAIFRDGPKFAARSSGGAVSTTNLQGAFNNSLDPEIQVPSGKDLSIQSATGNDADIIFNIKNNAGTPTVTIKGNGDIVQRNLTITGTGGNGFADLTNQSSDPSSPSSGVNRIYPNSLGKLAKKMSNGATSTYQGIICSDIVDSAALTLTLTNTIVKSFQVPAGTFLSSGTDTIKIASRAVKSGTLGNCNYRMYTNTSNSLSGATLLGTQTNSAAATFFGLIRNGLIKSSTRTEFVLNSFSVSGDEAATSSTGGAGTTDVNIDHTVANWYIQAAALGNAADSVVCSMLKIYRD